MIFIDPDGNEPTKAGAIGLNALIKKLNDKGVSSLEDFYGFYDMHIAPASNNYQDSYRYLWSNRWGWIDLKHSAAAANTADYLFVSGDLVLERGESNERQQSEHNDPSGYDYEDLVSNLIGVFFENWLEDQPELSDEQWKEIRKNGDKSLLTD
jgi:hypothetical protein